MIDESTMAPGALKTLTRNKICTFSSDRVKELQKQKWKNASLIYIQINAYAIIWVIVSGMKSLWGKEEVDMKPGEQATPLASTNSPEVVLCAC